MKKIMFICTGNTCRSAMAQAIFNHYVKENTSLSAKYEAVSSGIMAVPGEGPTRYAVDALQKLGIDLSDHKADSLKYELIKEAYLVLCMTKNHKDALLSLFPAMVEKIFTLSEYARISTGEDPESSFDIVDPYGRTPEFYEYTASQIKTAVNKILDAFEAEK